jgi:hypothetical protein
MLSTDKVGLDTAARSQAEEKTSGAICEEVSTCATGVTDI